MIKQAVEKHSTANKKLCIFFNCLFCDTKVFNKHLQESHSLPPVTQIRNSEGRLPQASAFGGTVQT